MPWKNGGGETVEIAIAPPDAGIDAFDWRVSMATIAADGVFSTFTGIDRTLCILEGAGIALTLADRQPRMIDRTSAPFAFSGDHPASASLVNGRVTDFNVMTRRSRYRHAVRRIPLDRDGGLICDADVAVVFAHAGIVDITIGSDTEQLEPSDAFVRDAAEDGTVTLHASVPSVVYLVTISAR